MCIRLYYLVLLQCQWFGANIARCRTARATEQTPEGPKKTSDWFQARRALGIRITLFYIYTYSIHWRADRYLCRDTERPTHDLCLSVSEVRGERAPTQTVGREAVGCVCFGWNRMRNKSARHSRHDTSTSFTLTERPTLPVGHKHTQFFCAALVTCART